ASLAALAGYPFVVEPYLAAHEQVVFWSWLFTGFAASCAALAWLTPPSAVETDREESAATKPPYLLWLSLAATGSVLLLAVTNHLTQNVASVPLLWLAPLTLYLLSFILTFEGRGRHQPSGAGCEPRRAARGHGLRGLRQSALPARRARLRAQLLRGHSSEGVRLPGRGKLPSSPGARRDHARRAIPVRRAAQADHHL